jgi:hypothetical protein
MTSWLDRQDAIVISVVLFITMLLMVLAGGRVTRMWNKGKEEPQGGVKNLLTVLYTLSGFILAFTFGMSGTRYEKIREAIEEEANSIETTIRRADLYPDSLRVEFRTESRNYLEAIISYYSNPKDINLVLKSKDDAHHAGLRLFAIAAEQSRNPALLAQTQQMVPALNDMLDAAQKREIVFRSHVPDLIIIMLFVCVLTSCFVSGFTANRIHHKEWVIIIGFTLVSVLVIYTTLDLARPTRGFIKADAGRDAMKEMRYLFIEKNH